MKRDDTEKRAKVKVIQFDQHQHALTELEQHCETFADVGGLEDIKKKINMDFILPLQNPEYFKAFGKATGKSSSVWPAGMRQNIYRESDCRRDQSKLYTLGASSDIVHVCWAERT